MIHASKAILAYLTTQVVATIASNVTPTRPVPSYAPLQQPAHPGPSPSVVAGPHPSFAWPPTGSFPNPLCNTVQYDFPAGTNSDPTRANAVRDFYATVWDRYDQYCFGHDDINILDNTCVDDLFGWGATIVDGVDTAIVMNLTAIASKQLAHIAQTDFTTANSLVDGFDAIIRYLGGLLSAYDLLTNGYVPKGTYNQAHVDALLSQAKTLGDKLLVQFETPSGLPTAYINFTTNEPVNGQFTDPLNNVTYNATNVAVAGTLVLEFHRLTDLTGDLKYRLAADRCNANLIFPHPPPVYPGLVGSECDINTGNYLTFDFGWKAGIDSFIEYLIKTYYYNPEDIVDFAYKEFWVTTAQSSIEHIALHPYGFPELTYLSEGDASGNLMWQMDDYACFAGGNLLLGGKYLDLPDIYNLGLAVADSCHWFYNTTKAGLGPASWGWYNASNLAYDEAEDNNATYRAQAKQFGYYLTDPEYASFPESIESFFYAWRITGDQRWQEYNWAIFNNLKAEHNAQTPYASISNVEQPGSLVTYLPSFFFAEVLKYLYLSFAEPNVVNLDDWVFNTECHPMRRNAKSC